MLLMKRRLWSQLFLTKFLIEIVDSLPQDQDQKQQHLVASNLFLISTKSLQIVRAIGFIDIEIISKQMSPQNRFVA